jgi:hypothetical protein
MLLRKGKKINSFNPKTSSPWGKVLKERRNWGRLLLIMSNLKKISLWLRTSPKRRIKA